MPAIALLQRRREEPLNCIQRLSAVLRSGQDEAALDGSEQDRRVVVSGRAVVAERDQCIPHRVVPLRQQGPGLLT